MKIYGKIESKILFINEGDKDELIKKYQKEYSINVLDTIYFDDGNILKVELLKSKFLKNFDDILR